MNEYSVWLIPAEPWLVRFRKIIENISKENNTPSFEPHITILIKNDEEEKMISVVEQLAKQISKPVSKLTQIDHETSYFRALYIKAEKQKLFEAHMLARKFVGMLADPYYLPHLSLLYGNMNENIKKNIIKNLDVKLPMDVEFDRITLWRTGVDIPVSEWKKVVDIQCQK